MEQPVEEKMVSAGADLIPTRRPITELTVDRVASVWFNKLVGAWGLKNAKKIVAALQTQIKDESKKRKEGEEE